MKSAVTAALLLLLTLSAGCSLFHHGRRSQASIQHPASAVEADFRNRWMQKRTGELLASGAAKADADAQAAAEFAKLYPFIGAPAPKSGR